MIGAPTWRTHSCVPRPDSSGRPAESLWIYECSPGIPMSRDAARMSAHATNCRLALVRGFFLASYGRGFGRNRER
jgi:hypothetical protein